MQPQPPDEPEFDDKSVFSGPPHSRESEEAVIGSVLINPRLYDTLADVLASRDFYTHRLGFIWDAFARLSGRSMDIDILTVSEELERMGHLEEIGGQAFLTILLNQCPTTLHAESYAATVKEYSGKREFLIMANKLAEFSLNGKTVVEISAFVEKESSRISVLSSVDTNAILSSRDAMKLGMDVTEKSARGDIVAVPTGLVDVDKYFRGGARGGRLLLVAGRPGDGKSSFLLTLANNAAVMHKKRVGIFSMEMPTEEQVNRLVAQLSGIDCGRIESGQLLDEDWPIYYHFVEVVAGLEIYWDDTPSLTVPQLRAKARKMAEMGLDMIVLDSLNLMNAQMPGAKTFEKINEMGYQLKILARELDIPLWAAHHMSRSIEQGGDREPQLSDLEQAGEKPADVVGFLHQKKDDPSMANVRFLKIAKHRGGPLGSVPLIFRSNITKFENATAHTFSLREEPKEREYNDYTDN